MKVANRISKQKQLPWIVLKLLIQGKESVVLWGIIIFSVFLFATGFQFSKSIKSIILSPYQKLLPEIIVCTKDGLDLPNRSKGWIHTYLEYDGYCMVQGDKARAVLYDVGICTVSSDGQEFSNGRSNKTGSSGEKSSPTLWLSQQAISLLAVQGVDVTSKGLWVRVRLHKNEVGVLLKPFPFHLIDNHPWIAVPNTALGELGLDPNCYVWDQPGVVPENDLKYLNDHKITYSYLWKFLPFWLRIPYKAQNIENSLTSLDLVWDSLSSKRFYKRYGPVIIGLLSIPVALFVLLGVVVISIYHAVVFPVRSLLRISQFMGSMNAAIWLLVEAVILGLVLSAVGFWGGQGAGEYLANQFGMWVGW